MYPWDIDVQLGVAYSFLVSIYVHSLSCLAIGIDLVRDKGARE